MEDNVTYIVRIHKDLQQERKEHCKVVVTVQKQEVNGQLQLLLKEGKRQEMKIARNTVTFNGLTDHLHVHVGQQQVTSQQQLDNTLFFCQGEQVFSRLSLW